MYTTHLPKPPECWNQNRFLAQYMKFEIIIRHTFFLFRITCSVPFSEKLCKRHALPLLQRSVTTHHTFFIMTPWLPLCELYHMWNGCNILATSTYRFISLYCIYIHTHTLRTHAHIWKSPVPIFHKWNEFHIWFVCWNLLENTIWYFCVCVSHFHLLCCRNYYLYSTIYHCRRWAFLCVLLIYICLDILLYWFHLTLPVANTMNQEFLKLCTAA